MRCTVVLKPPQVELKGPDKCPTFLKSSRRADSEYVSKQIFRWGSSKKYPNFGFSDTHPPYPGPEGPKESQQITFTPLLSSFYRVRHSNHSQARRALGSRRPHSNCVYRIECIDSKCIDPCLHILVCHYQSLVSLFTGPKGLREPKATLELRVSN